LVVAYRKVVRHIQLKAMTEGGKRNDVNIGLKLMEKPSGCVVWIVVTPQLDLSSFLWFGGAPGQPLPDISSLKVVKHTKGNAEGIKTERPNHRLVPRSRFEQVGTLDVLPERLLGPLP